MQETKVQQDVITARDSKACMRKLELDSNKDLVDTIIENTVVISAAQAEVDRARKVLDGVVEEQRKIARKFGIFSRVISMVGSNSAVDYLAKNSFKTLPPFSIGELKKRLGSWAPVFFQPTEKVKLRSGAAEELKELLGDRFNDYFEVKAAVAPVKDFREKLFENYELLDEDQLAALEEYEADLSNKHQMTVK